MTPIARDSADLVLIQLNFQIYGSTTEEARRTSSSSDLLSLSERHMGCDKASWVLL